MGEKHSAANLKVVLSGICEEAQIDPCEQLSGIVSDSGSDILCAVKEWQAEEYGEDELPRRLRFEQGYFMISLPCMAHCVHNAVMKSIKETPGILSAIENVRKFIGWTRKSSNILRFLKKAQEDDGVRQTLKPKLDQETRWHSTYHMLARYLVLQEYYKVAINKLLDASPQREKRLIQQKSKTVFDEEATEQLREIEKLLGALKDCTRKLESSQGLSLSYTLLVYFHLIDSLLAATPSDTSTMSDFKRVFRTYINERIDKQELGGATATCLIDPRFMRPQKMIENVSEQEVERLMEWVNQNEKSLQNLKCFVQSFWSRNAPIPYELSVDDLYVSADAAGSGSGLCMAPSNFHDLFKQEWAAYLHKARVSEQPPLQFWRHEANYLPLLSGAARMLIPFPASSAGPERVFSIAGWTQDARRQRLHAKTLKNLLTLRHCWLGWLDCTKTLPEPPTKTGELDIEESSDDEGDGAMEVHECVDLLED